MPIAGVPERVKLFARGRTSCVRRKDGPVATPHDEYQEWFRSTWEPPAIRDLMGRVGCYLVAYEMTKRRVVDDICALYCAGFDEPGRKHSTEYVAEVLDLDRTSAYRASCAWLVNAKALTTEQVETLEELRDTRNQITHELWHFLVNPSRMLADDLLVRVRDCLRALVVFWGRVNVEATAEFDKREVSVEDITAGDLMIFDALVAVVAGLRDDR
jgi:hypothetical protein